MDTPGTTCGDGHGRGGLLPVLTPELAQDIARDIGTITGFNVLITDRDAVVIGCGDAARVGSVHEASFEVLHSGRPATHTAAEAARLGVKPGISLPITVGEDAIGTVCLTGRPADVRRFGLVVQRQTEILLEESALLRSRMLHERVVDDFVRDVALYDPASEDAEELEARAADLGLAPGPARTAVLLRWRDAGEPEGHGAEGHGADGHGAEGHGPVLRTVREVFRGPQDVAAETATGRFTVLAAGTDGGDDGTLERRCERLLDLLRDRHGLDMQLALGEPGFGMAGMHRSCRDAATALRIGPTLLPGRRIFGIGELRVPQLVASAPADSRRRYAGSVLGELRRHPDWPVLRRTLIGWAEGGFSLLRAAERLHVHRNTLIYRLDKATRLSGVDVRDPQRALAMYTACVAELLTEPG